MSIGYTVGAQNIDPVHGIFPGAPQRSFRKLRTVTLSRNPNVIQNAGLNRAQSGFAVDEDHVIPSLGDVDIIISHDAPRPALRRSRLAIVMTAISRHAEGVAGFWRQRAPTGDLLQPFPRQRDFHRPSAVA